MSDLGETKEEMTLRLRRTLAVKLLNWSESGLITQFKSDSAIAYYEADGYKCFVGASVTLGNSSGVGQATWRLAVDKFGNELAELFALRLSHMDVNDESFQLVLTSPRANKSS